MTHVHVKNPCLRLQLRFQLISTCNFIDFFYETKEAVLRSPYYKKLEKLAQDLDSIYKDISQNDLDTNFKKYYELLKGFISRKISELGDLSM